MRLDNCLSKNLLEKFRQLVAAGPDDLAVIFKPLILTSSEGDVVPMTNFVMFPTGILLQKTSAPISTQRSLSWLPFSAYRASPLIPGEVRPRTLTCQLS